MHRRVHQAGARRVFVWVLGVGLVNPLVGWSQTPRCAEPSSGSAQSEDAVAESVFDEGRRLAQANRWGDALPCFQRACELVPSPLCLRWQVVAHHTMGSYVDAARALARYDAARRGASHEDVERVREVILARVGRLRLVPEGPVPLGVTFSLDGVNVSAAALDERITVEPGTHLFEARGANRESVRLSIEVAGGDDRAISVAIPRERFSLVRQWWFWTGIGLVVASAVVGGVVLANSGVADGPPVRNRIGDIIQATTVAP